MSAKYYTHFIAAQERPSKKEGPGEWSGVVELRYALERDGGTRQLRTLLAQSFDLPGEEIRILHWSRVH